MPERVYSSPLTSSLVLRHYIATERSVVTSCSLPRRSRKVTTNPEYVTCAQCRRSLIRVVRERAEVVA